MASNNSTQYFCICCSLTFMIYMPYVSRFALGHNVLLLPFPWPSHFTLMEKIGIELDRIGHNVTIAVPSSEDYTENTRLKRIVYNVKAERNAFVSVAERRLKSKQGFGISWLSEICKILVNFGDAVLENGQIHSLANTTHLIISDIAFIAVPVISEYHKIPWIYLSPFGHMAGLKGDLFGAAVNPSYVPVYMATATFERVSTGKHMNFLERSFNLFASICTWVVRELVVSRPLHALSAKYGTDSATTLTKKTSMVLIPMDYVLEYPRMDSPHIKLIGPLTACKQEGELESPFSDITREANGRLLLVSFGTASGLSTDDAVRLLEAVQFINYTVIMRYDTNAVKMMAKEGKLSLYTNRNGATRKSETHVDITSDHADDRSCLCTCKKTAKRETAISISMTGKRRGNTPCAYRKNKIFSKACNDRCANSSKTQFYYSMMGGKKKFSLYSRKPIKPRKGVRLGNSTYVFDFIPQQKLLQNSEHSIILTHCGLNSVYEALYHGRLIICMPLFGDHFESAGRLLNRKLGRVVPFGEMNGERLQYELDILTHDKIYLDNVRKASKRLRRRMMSSVEEAAFWIETVLSEDGDMEYLKPSFGNMSLPVYLCLDVIVFWLIVVGVLIRFIWFACRKLWRRHQ